MDEKCNTGAPKPSMRDSTKASFDEVCSVAQKIKSMAAEARDRLFGTEPSPAKPSNPGERISPDAASHIMASGFSDLREIQVGAERILDEILTKL